MSDGQIGAKGGEWVVVAIGEQQFAIDIMSVREIRGWTTSTPLPQSPPFVLGMINLRGAILPVADLSARLGLGPADARASSVVVVVQVDGREFGVLVDAVCDILHIAENQAQPPPDVGAGQLNDFVQGLITTDAGIVSMLSLGAILPTLAQAA
jgi:purine-binding chemotaxis protein CheW